MFWVFFCSFKYALIVLLINMQEADLVTTHELGHNFGAEHDPDNIAYCAPSDEQGGKFVMYPIAVSGDHSNNKVQSIVSTTISLEFIIFNNTTSTYCTPSDTDRFSHETMSRINS